MTLRRLKVPTSAVVGLMNLSIALITVNQVSKVDRAKNLANSIVDSNLILKESKYHVVQIQQLLTDASLTADAEVVSDQLKVSIYIRHVNLGWSSNRICFVD